MIWSSRDGPNGLAATMLVHGPRVSRETHHPDLMIECHHFRRHLSILLRMYDCVMEAIYMSALGSTTVLIPRYDFLRSRKLTFITIGNADAQFLGGLECRPATCAGDAP
jgi:hypothetical protein